MVFFSTCQCRVEPAKRHYMGEQHCGERRHRECRLARE
jgi:hypothetical protein